MSWQLLILISIVTTSLSMTLQRVLIQDKKSDPVAFAIVFQLLTGVMIGIYALIGGFKLPDIKSLWPFLIVMVILYSATTMLRYKALKLTELPEFMIIFQSRVIWMILVPLLVMQEKFTWVQWLGTLLILTSVALTNNTKGKLKLGKGEILALLAAATIGLGFANDAYIVRQADVASYTTLSFTLPAIITWLTFPSSTKYLLPLCRKDMILKLLAVTICYAISAITVLMAYKVGHNAAQISSIHQTTTILTVLLAIIFLGEKGDLWKKALGTILSFVGVLLVI